MKQIKQTRDFVSAWRENAEHLASEGLYDPAEEHDACGVGLVTSIDGKPRRAVVEAGIEALKAVWHRGAVDADGKTGDGAGIHLQIPQDFFREHVAQTGHRPGKEMLAVGMVFLPRTDFGAQERCRVLVEREILNFGYTIYGWRQVPVNTEIVGEKANATRPEIEQVMIANSRHVSDRQFEIDLYIIRRRIEKAAEEESIQDFYICSLSCRSVIYKGMFLAEQLSTFYPDLQDERFASNFVIFHQRYSTNTFPTWRLAQPFRILAHNGEINTLKGNVNWMQAHECRMASETFADHVEDLKPVIAAGSSDSAALDAVAELMVRAGRHLPMVKTMLIPEAWGQDPSMPAGLPRSLQLLQRGDGALGRPGRGLRLRRALGGGRHGPQRPPAHALHHHQRRPALRRIGDRHGAHRRAAHRREGPPRPRPDDRRRPGGWAALPQRRDQGPPRRAEALRRVDRQRHLHRRPAAARTTASRCAGRGRPCAGASSPTA